MSCGDSLEQYKVRSPGFSRKRRQPRFRLKPGLRTFFEGKMQIEVLGQDCFSDSGLIAELFQLLVPSFEEPAQVLQRAMEKSSRLYLGKDATGRVISFFFCDFGSHLIVAGSPLPSLYLGLKGQELPCPFIACVLLTPPSGNLAPERNSGFGELQRIRRYCE